MMPPLNFYNFSRGYVFGISTVTKIPGMFLTLYNHYPKSMRMVAAKIDSRLLRAGNNPILARRIAIISNLVLQPGFIVACDNESLTSSMEFAVSKLFTEGPALAYALKHGALIDSTAIHCLFTSRPCTLVSYICKHCNPAKYCSFKEFSSRTNNQRGVV